MQSFGTSKEFIKGAEIEWEVVGEGVKRKIMAFDDRVMLVSVHFEKGAIGALHDHYHTQVTYISSGKFDVTINGVTQTLEEGDSFYIPPHAIHGVVCLENGILTDVFSPIREDFMQGRTY
ncbi:cupin domain-containing protein [Flavobacterium sp. Fl-77]|uniref:Cupin domain-containing protein n=1 Tax=Flavobacterium flavipigmentatum TaxID=2893884 RepID=A0AAJ2VZ73_9FLAO|nr:MULTISPECIES: cupin domain-containing protein [unclassified Flavobacterium]MDX6181956.1 cupin domain-containing protein [Flavobacterium sp. Fl-33]MDX6186989.1 cupin domain-containing protein [Flavobacterium sp. Fl-77]UFH37124.1 cupin domain-containing protein [Flavobacterium sp. F-70]